jgi:hypothetical protein
MTTIQGSMDQMVVVREAGSTDRSLMHPPQVERFRDVPDHDPPLHGGHPEIEIRSPVPEDLFLRVPTDVFPKAPSDHAWGLRIEVHGAGRWEGIRVAKDVGPGAEQLAVGQDPIGSRGCVERARCPPKEIGRQSIVRIESHDPLSTSDADPGVPRRGLTPVLGVANQEDPRIAASVDEIRDVDVDRAVIDDDRFPVLLGLSDDAFEAVPEELERGFEARDHDREQRRLAPVGWKRTIALRHDAQDRAAASRSGRRERPTLLRPRSFRVSHPGWATSDHRRGRRKN